jgi:Flp pilus assembly pilin Flp
MDNGWHACRSFLREEHALTSVEYAMLAVLVATVCLATLSSLSTNLLNLYTVVCNAVSSVASGSPSC